MADWTKSVDPGGTGDYSSLNAAEAAAPGAGNNIILTCFSSNGSDDTTAVQFSGTGDNVSITGTDFPADGVWDDTEYQLYVTSSATAIDIRNANTTVKNLQVRKSGTAYETILVYNVGGCVIDGCIARDGGISIALYIPSSNSVTVKNSIFWNGAGRGARCYGAGATYLYNCVFCDGGDNGVERSAGTVTVKNCAVFNNTDDFDGTITIEYCASDEGAGTGTGGVDISATWDSTCFTDTNGLGPDWSVQDTESPLYHTGTNLSLGTDIIGNSWHATTPSIGAFEYVAATGGLSIPVAMYHYMHH